MPCSSRYTCVRCGVTCACPILVTFSDSQPSSPMFAVLALFVSSIWYTPMELCDDTHSIIELSNSSSVENGNFGYDKSEFSVFDNLDTYNNFHDINFQLDFSNFARFMLEPNHILRANERMQNIWRQFTKVRWKSTFLTWNSSFSVDSSCRLPRDLTASPPNVTNASLDTFDTPPTSASIHMLRPPRFAGLALPPPSCLGVPDQICKLHKSWSTGPLPATPSKQKASTDAPILPPMPPGARPFVSVDCVPPWSFLAHSCPDMNLMDMPPSPKIPIDFFVDSTDILSVKAHMSVFEARVITNDSFMVGGGRNLHEQVHTKRRLKLIPPVLLGLDDDFESQFSVFDAPLRSSLALARNLSAASVGSASFYIVGDVSPSPTHRLHSSMTPPFYYHLPAFAKFKLYPETISFHAHIDPHGLYPHPCTRRLRKRRRCHVVHRQSMSSHHDHASRLIMMLTLYVCYLAIESGSGAILRHNRVLRVINVLPIRMVHHVRRFCGRIVRCYCSCLTTFASFPLGTGEYIFAHISLFGLCRYKLKFLIIFSMISAVTAPGTRGSSSSSSLLPNINAMHPNTQRDYDFLPGVNRWDGIPYHDFELVWLAALLFALGSISMDGVTLRETAEGKDTHASSSDAIELAKYKARNTRLYACIMNYIKPDSYIVRYCKKEMPDNGNALFTYISEHGKLRYDDDTWKRMNLDWDKMTMAKVGIEFTPKAIWLWLEKVDLEGMKCKKDENEKRDKFLEGFPESFDVVITHEKLEKTPGNFKIRNNYPAHHPKAGTHNPKAGQADLYALASHFEPEWVSRCKRGLIKRVPRGSIYQSEMCETADDDSNHDQDSHDESHDDESANYTSRHGRPSSSRSHSRPHTKHKKYKKHPKDKKHHKSNSMHDANAVKRSSINAKMICVVCGGRGHASSVEGMDCLTKQLGITIPREELAATRYPKGLRFPNLSKKNAKQIDVDDDPSSSDDEVANEAANESSSSEGSVAAKFAVTYHTITHTKPRYESMSSSDDETPKPKPHPKSKSKVNDDSLRLRGKGPMSPKVCPPCYTKPPNGWYGWYKCGTCDVPFAGTCACGDTPICLSSTHPQPPSPIYCCSQDDIPPAALSDNFSLPISFLSSKSATTQATNI